MILKIWIWLFFHLLTLHFSISKKKSSCVPKINIPKPRCCCSNCYKVFNFIQIGSSHSVCIFYCKLGIGTLLMLESSIAQIIFTKTNLSFRYCLFLNFSSFEGNTSHLLRSTRFDNNLIWGVISYNNEKIAIIMFCKKLFDFFQKSLGKGLKNILSKK